MRVTRGLDHKSVELAGVDLTDPALYSEGDPHSVWRAMRERSPVHWQAVEGKGGFWSVTRFADAERVLRDHEVFTSERGNLLDILGRDDPSNGKQLAITDPPRHTAMRAPVQRALAVKEIQDQNNEILREVRLLFEPIRDGQEIDFAELAARFSTQVTAIGMGIVRDDLHEVLRYTTSAVAPDDPDYQLPGGRQRTVETAHRELVAYFADVVMDPASRRRDGLIDYLLEMELEDGRTLSTSEVVSNCYGLVLGTNVATPHVPTGTLLELLTNGGYEEWAARPEVTRTGVEEALRWTAPAIHVMRYAKTDIEIGDQKVNAGDAVVAWIPAANRDPSVYDEPDRFDVRRHPNRHLTFSAGPHYCVGHTVARAALQIFFSELFKTFSEFRLAGEEQHLRSNAAAAIKHLPVVAKRRS